MEIKPIFDNPTLFYKQLIDCELFDGVDAKIETNLDCHIILTPVDSERLAIVAKIFLKLLQFKQKGKVLNFPKVLTEQGVKVPDIGFYSIENISHCSDRSDFIANKFPDICIDIFQGADFKKQDVINRHAIFTKGGAKEYWYYTEENILFCDATDYRAFSEILRDFPPNLFRELN